MEDNRNWYVVNTYSGHENKVKANLMMRSETMNMTDYIFRVIVPERTEVEYKDGEKKEKVKKTFPGYVLVEMIMTDESWYVVRNTPGVTGFIGSSGGGAKPLPLYPHEIEPILSSMGIKLDEVSVDISKGDHVVLTAGAFENMKGVVESVDLDDEIIIVLIDLFGQETPVEIALGDVKLDNDAPERPNVD